MIGPSERITLLPCQAKPARWGSKQSYEFWHESMARDDLQYMVSHGSMHARMHGGGRAWHCMAARPSGQGWAEYGGWGGTSAHQTL